MGLIPKPEREPNGYRVYTERHLLQMRLLRTAFRAEILSGNLRKIAIDIVKTSAAGDLDAATQKALSYREYLEIEIDHAREAIRLTEEMINGGAVENEGGLIGRREAAALIGVSFDVLRDWERNGLIQVPRRGNRREYGAPELNRLRIIAVLRNANYSQAAILRMLKRAEYGADDLISAIDTPEPDDDIISVADRYITSLTGALADAGEMLRQLGAMKNEPKQNNPPVIHHF